MKGMTPAEYVRLKEKRARKPENVAVWAKARQDIAAIEAQTELTDNEKQQRIDAILISAQSMVDR